MDATMRCGVTKLLSGLLACGLAVAAPAFAGCQIESIEMPVRMVGSRAVATVGINGTQVPLMVDSGAFFSVLTDAAAEQLKLETRRSDVKMQGLVGKADTRSTVVDKLRLFKGDVDRVQFLVGGNESGAGTMGFMGRNILSFTDTEYDLAHGMIRFLFPNDDCAKTSMAYWAGSTPVTEVDLLYDRSKTPAIRTEVKLNGSTFIALLDTGATTLVTARAARSAGVDEAQWKPAGMMYGVGRGNAKEWVAPFEKFELGGESIARNRLLVGDFSMTDADLLLGIDFFLSHRIYVSKSRSKMFVTYNGGPVFALDKVEPPATATATAAADPAATDTATTADEFARRGAASAARRDYTGALADLDRACALEPTSGALLAQRGVVQEALKHPLKAREDFDRALALDPAQNDARLRRVALRYAAKDRDGAKADLDALDGTLSPQDQMRLTMGQLYLLLEQPAQALVQFNQWLPAHRTEMRRDVALNQRCWARVQLGIELDQALDDCDEALDRDGKNPVYLDSRGWAYLRLGKDRKALADFDRGLEFRASSPLLLYGRGLARTHLGDPTQGTADIAAARKLLPDIDRRTPMRGEAPPEPTKP